MEHDGLISRLHKFALQILAQHEILSAPLVMLADLEDSGGVAMTPQLLGWIDIADVLKALLLHLRTCERDIPMKMLALMTALEKEGPRFADKTLITVRAADDRGLVFQADGSTTSVMTAIRDLFLQNYGGEAKITHRIALFDTRGEITSIISQMDVMRWLLSSAVPLGNTLQKTIESLGLLTGKPPVVTVNPHMPALMAYDVIATAGVSGAPVITDQGELIANLSVSDLRALTSEHFGILALPVAEFLALEHGTAYIGYSVNSSEHSRHPFFASSQREGGPAQGDVRIFTVHRDSTLLDVIHKFVDNHIHRVYVVQPSTIPRVDAVLTLTDVLRFLGGVW